jgi:hypothetical protein
VGIHRSRRLGPVADEMQEIIEDGEVKRLY